MSSHRQIFKSTAIIGAAQVAGIVIGILRTKVLAVLLGPVGVGLSGTYLTVTGFIDGITGFGLGASGVRQIAAASATGDTTSIARTVLTLRRVSLVSGIVGMVVALALCVPLSHMTFGDGSRAGDLALMSLTLLCGGIAAGQFALLQGLRLLGDLGKAQVAGAFFGSLCSVGLVYFLGEKGVAPFLVANALLAVAFSFRYARRVQVPVVQMTWAETLGEARGLMGLGLAFVVQNLLLGGSAYLSRVLIIRGLGLGAVGLYTATWTLSSYYVGIVLKAMGTDFYPRLTAVASDHPATNRLVNEQVEMGILIAVPGVLGVLAVAPWALQILYSGDFVGGAHIIRWQVLGVFVQVISWPVGLIQLGQGRAKLMVASEALSATLAVSFLLAGIGLWKLEGIGIAFFASNFLIALYAWALARRLSGFAWTRRCQRFIAVSGLSVLAVFLAVRSLPPLWSLAVGLLAAAVAAIVSYVALRELLAIDLWQLALRKLGLSRER